jgi:hypothetical protein
MRGCAGQLLQRGGLELADVLAAGAEFGGEAVVRAGRRCGRAGIAGGEPAEAAPCIHISAGSSASRLDATVLIGFPAMSTWTVT